MFNKIKKLFSKPEIKMGDKWKQKSERDNPFKNTYVKVEDFKEGWVLFRSVFDGHESSHKDSYSEESFRSLFCKME